MKITVDALEIIFTSITSEENAKILAGMVYPLLITSNSYEDAKRVISFYLMSQYSMLHGDTNLATTILPHILKIIDIIEEEDFTLK